jgi:uncharacterized protein with FMN-binding domain
MTVKKKLGIAVLIMVVVIFVAGQFAMAAIEKNFETLKEDPAKEVDLTRVEDGTYQGSHNVFPVMVELEVLVKDHKIVSIELLKHQNGQGAPAEALLETVVEEQSIMVDDVAGATYSSMVIKKALENALK